MILVALTAERSNQPVDPEGLADSSEDTNTSTPTAANTNLNVLCAASQQS